MLKSFIVIALVCLASYTWSSTPFKACEADAGTIQDFQVTDCNAAPCILKKGNTYSMNLTFQAKAPSNAVQVLLHGKVLHFLKMLYCIVHLWPGVIAGVPVPFPLNNSDACTLGVKCPVSANDVNVASFSLPVLSTYPSLSLYVKIELQAPNPKQDYACLLFPAVISNGNH